MRKQHDLHVFRPPPVVSSSGQRCQQCCLTRRGSMSWTNVVPSCEPIATRPAPRRTHFNFDFRLLCVKISESSSVRLVPTFSRRDLGPPGTNNRRNGRAQEFVEIIEDLVPGFQTARSRQQFGACAFRMLRNRRGFGAWCPEPKESLQYGRAGFNKTNPKMERSLLAIAGMAWHLSRRIVARYDQNAFSLI